MSHDHDQGLAFDLSTMIERRRILGLAALTVLAGCNPFSGEATMSASAADGAVCVKDPAETAGPFPGDGTNKKAGQTVNVLTQSGVAREDIRTSFAGMTPIADGAQFDLILKVADVGKSCAPLAGRAVYIWHCDKDGKYSLYDTDDSNYLRGVGVTDANGEVKFTTIFPGCYAGRWPHIHFEVFDSAEKAVSGDASRLISQFALPADACKAVYEGSQAYAASVDNLLRSRPLEQDGIFADNTPEQVAAQTITVTGDASGWKGSVTVGIAG